jgi:hypothetical protein
MCVSNNGVENSLKLRCRLVGGRDGRRADNADRGDVTRPTQSKARCALRIATLALAPALLAGCGLSSITSGIGGGILGGGAKTEAAAPSGVSKEQLLSAAKSDGGEVLMTAAVAGAGCPQMLIDSREKHLTTYEAGRTGDGLAIVHQGEITKVARECELQPGVVTVKYGFSGRVLLGPKGQPGVIQLPFQMFVTDANRERVQGESMKVDVAIPPDSPIGYFSTVRVVTFKIPEGARPADYKIFVAFDKSVPASLETAPQKGGKPRKG